MVALGGRDQVWGDWMIANGRPAWEAAVSRSVGVGG